MLLIYFNVSKGLLILYSKCFFMSSKIEIQRICLHCGKSFTAKTTVTKFCSKSCNDKNYKDQLKQQKIQQSNIQTNAMVIQSINELLQKPYLTAKEAAKVLGVETRTIHRLVKNGSLQSINLGKRLTRIPGAQLLAFKNKIS